MCWGSSGPVCDLNNVNFLLQSVNNENWNFTIETFIAELKAAAKNETLE